jgi:hypothetical protein
VKTRVPRLPAAGNRVFQTVLQFNCETSVTYDEAGFSTISIRGILEIPLTRLTQADRNVPNTVDDFRSTWIQSAIDAIESIDLTRFRVTRREFPISRDKRTMEWDFQAEELPYMGLPPEVTIARGSYTVRPSKASMALINWFCTLRVTYTVRKDRPRRFAWAAFLALLRIRMRASESSQEPILNQNPGPGLPQPGFAAGPGAQIAYQFATYLRSLFRRPAPQPLVPGPGGTAWLVDFQIEEGMYLDSRSITFSASWKLITTFASILKASGIWKKEPTHGGNTWKASVQDIMGWTSWEENRINGDVIVDFGGP